MSGITIETDGGSPGTTNETLDPGQFAIGVNLSGMEYNGGPLAVAGVNYVVPTLAELTYYHSQGLDLIRLPISWETLQTTLRGSLNATYLAQIKSVVSNAASLGMRVILDIHDFGGYNGIKLGTAAVNDADFANLWQQLAAQFVGNVGIGGYDLMNEPSNMPSATAWTNAAQAAITAIRKIDMATPIYVEGNDYSNSQNWATDNPGLAQLSDPANDLIFSGHLYLDTDDSGTHFDWAQEAAAGDTTQIGVQRLTPFVAWLTANHLRGEIGELGVGNDNPAWLLGLQQTLAYAQANNLAVTYWAGGPWWGNYPMSIEPLNGVSTAQTAVLDGFSGDYPTVSVAQISGTAPAGATVYLSENDVLLTTTRANNYGDWSDTLTGLSKGLQVVVAGLAPPTEDGTIAATVFNLTTGMGSTGWAPGGAACFAAGTRIATPVGDIAIEDLRVGDAVRTATGVASIIWIGRRLIDIGRHNDPDAVRPIRISAGALAELVPARDLIVSPDHALLLGGVLVPAKVLINGVTIVPLGLTHVVYFHIELPVHDIIFAESAPAESYLDTGNRASFDDWSPLLTLDPEFAQTMREAMSCARFAEDGPVVESVRAGILARAEIDLIDDPDLRVIHARGEAVISSRSAIPGHIMPDPRDRRVLGVKIGGLRAGAHVIRIDHRLLVEGWHDMEPDGRWTNGRAVVPKSLMAGAGTLSPTIVATMRYHVPNLREPGRRYGITRG